MKSKIIQIFWKNLNVKLVFVYLIIAALCTGFVLLANYLFSDFRKHKEQYRLETQILLKTGNLVSHFYSLQEYANLFLVNKDASFLKTYQTEVNSFQQELEQILQFTNHEDENIFLNEILDLLYEKKIMLMRLHELFDDKTDIDILYKKIIGKIEGEIDDVIISRLEANSMAQNDTVWKKPKNFGQRLKEAFRPAGKRGKEIATINSAVFSDTTSQTTVVITPLIDSLYILIKDYQYQYDKKLGSIENELQILHSADQLITREITTLLLKLHQTMLLNVISLGEDYEKNVYDVLTWSTVGGGIALLVITTLIIFIFINLKTIRKTHEALRVEKLKTEEQMENRHQLLLAISHDIKTPLNALLGYLELWETLKLHPKQHKELHTMKYSGKYILALLNNLLEFTRLEQHKSQIIVENIEIKPFFMDILMMFQPMCIEKTNKLTYNINVDDHLQVLLDSLKLKQIVVNLISNAVKYCSKGEVQVNVETIQDPDFQLKITISDTGKGIPKEKIAMLFEPFTRIEQNSAGIEGSGLGLYVVKGLVDLMKGTIEIETEENQGTSVTFTIPCENVPESAQSMVSQKESLKIWVVEDDVVQLQVFVSMLEKLGHTTISSTNKEEFEETVEMYINNTIPIDFNLVFSDLEIGNLSGYDVLKKLKSFTDIPVICLSGSFEISKTELQEIGFHDFLEKPFTLNQLEKILASIHNPKDEIAPSLFSVNTLNKMFKNDKEKIIALLDTFASFLPNDIKELEQALEEGNLSLVQQIAHRILPFCKQIEASEVTPILIKIERFRKQRNICFEDLKPNIILLVVNLRKLLIQILHHHLE